MADMTAEAVSQALKGASLIKLLSSLALNWPVQPNQATDKISLAQEQNKDLFQELKNELADLRRDNLKLRAKICRLSSETKSLQSITDSQEVELKKVKTDMGTLQTELTHTRNDLLVQTEKLNSLSSSETRTKAELRSALLEISELKKQQEIENETCVLFKQQLPDSNGTQIQHREHLGRVGAETTAKTSMLVNKDSIARQRCEGIGTRIREVEKGRRLPHQQPEPQSVHPHSFGSTVRDTLFYGFEQRKHDQDSDVTASSSLTVRDSPKTVHSLPEFPSMLPSSNRLQILRELARDIEVFNPKTTDNNIELYLKDVNAALTYFPEASMADKVFLLRKTTAQIVHGFMDRQSPAIANNYDKLCKALLVEYTLYQNPSASRLSAFRIKQGRHESPREYYERLRKMYFAGKDDTGAEEDVMFKSLFVSNLYPTVRKPLILMVDVENMSAGELRQPAMRAWDSIGTDREDREPFASVHESRHDSKTPIQMESELPQNSYAHCSNLQQSTESPRFSGYRGRNNHRYAPRNESRQWDDRGQRQKKDRDNSENGQKQSSHNRCRKSRGTKSKDAENLAEIQHILLKALKDLKSEEYISTDRDLVFSA
ncbi:uncharacterized protein LOC125269577 [Megalobrama amblycephala]|uniref:uncharacterized protein LOC125269577 n=1 Tax=Megalobrama amblycephala TaxID=75352 RepID=UPI0020142139|nr:uncharacterized protein LOC125269577 [Megalobrama amblycephala]